MSDPRLTLMEAISRKLNVEAQYNGATIRFSPHLMFERHGDLFVSALNLRRGPGTSNEIITAMPCGSALVVVAGPSNGWFQVNYNGTIGWSSGNFLLPEASFQRSVCGG